MNHTRVWTALAGTAMIALIIGCTAPPPTPTATTPAGATGAPGTAAPAATSAAKAPEPDPNARITMMLPAVAPSLDPFQGAGNPIVIPVRALFDTLVSIEETGQLTGNLATGWSNIDQLTWQFTLRPNVTFSNGEPFTAQTVADTVNYIVDPANQAPILSSIRTVARAEVVNPTTVRIVTTAPNPDTLYAFASVQMVPMNTFRSTPREQFVLNPPGTSMWTVSRMSPNQEVILTAREGSWRGTPKFRELRFVGNQSDALRANALRTGEVDIIEGVGSDSYAALQREGFARYVSSSQGVTYGVYMDSVQPGSPVASREARLALNYALDKDAIINAFARDQARAVGQFGYPGLPGWKDSIKPYPFDPAQARQLLAQSGQPNGFTTKMHLSTSGEGLVSNDVAQYLQAEWRRHLNVNVELDPIESAVISQLFRGGQYHPLRLTALGYNFLSTEFGFHLCEQPAPPMVRHCDPELDRLFNQARNEFDPARRVVILEAMNQRIHDNPVQVFLGNPYNIAMMTQKVSGYRQRFGGFTPWEEVSKAR